MKKRRFRYSGGTLSEGGRRRLAVFLAERAAQTKGLLIKWLGDSGREARVIGKADPDSLTYTLTFVGLDLGMIGQADLMFAGEDVLPCGVRFRVCAGRAGAAPVCDPAAGERRAVMEGIAAKTEELFIRRVRWLVSYYAGGRLTGTREIIDVDPGALMRVKTRAYHGAPPGTDMITLVTPEGKTLLRTEKKHWVRGDAPHVSDTRAAKDAAGARAAAD